MTAMKIPKFTKALTIEPTTTVKSSKPVYYETVLDERPLPSLKKGEVLVRVGAAAFNHRDVWIRKGQYPGISVGSVLGSDGAGTVIASNDASDPLLFKRVFFTPMRGWEKDSEAPESEFGILGGGNLPPLGTFAEYIVVERSQVIVSPAHLDDVQMSAWPLGGLTAWRAAIVYGRVRLGHNVLITGIGGGVALTAMQICVARGASVYVTSGSQEKVQRAITFGAKGGANYKDKNWPSHIGAMLARNGSSDGVLDVVIDSGGGDIMTQTGKILKRGGRVVCYGMTANPKITFTMREVLKNQQLIGSTMGSHQDLIDATKFLEEHRIVPIVSHVLDGLEAAEQGFKIIQRGDQFGKVVIKMPTERPEPRAKL